MKVAVIGGGISGLATAFRLQQAGCETTVYEAGARIGGKIHSERTQDYLVEHGPNGFLASRQSAVDLVEALGLSARLVPADERANRRYLYLGRRLEPLPNGPRSAFSTPVLSPVAKLRALSEPFRRTPAASADESIWDFATRRFGRQVAERLIDPMVTGVYAGNAKQLSVAACFPKLNDFESLAGSVVGGALRSRRAAKADGVTRQPPRLTSFAGGMGVLTDALGQQVETVRLNSPVSAIERTATGWRVRAMRQRPRVFDRVVVATPTDTMIRLLAPHVPAVQTPLAGIPYAPVAVLAVGFPTAQLPRPLDGFGFLVPSSAGRRVLGVLWPSAIFPQRAPAGQGLLRCIVGGARNPELLDLADDELIELVLAELGILMGGPMPRPSFTRLVRWPRAIPQYTIGHLDRVAAVTGAVATLPGIHLAGNALFGVSVPDCASRAEALVTEIMTA